MRFKRFGFMLAAVLILLIALSAYVEKQAQSTPLGDTAQSTDPKQ